MTKFNNYRHYRKLRLPNPWELAGMQTVVAPFIRGIAIGAVALAAYGIVTHKVEAGQIAADNRVVAKATEQSAYIKLLENILARCLSGGDKAITIGDEIWMCGSSNTGVKTK